LAFARQLPGHEPDRYDAVLFGCGQQPLARSLARCIVLESRLVEARERITNVRLVVNGQASPTL